MPCDGAIMTSPESFGETEVDLLCIVFELFLPSREMGLVVEFSTNNQEISKAICRLLTVQTAPTAACRQNADITEFRLKINIKKQIVIPMLAVHIHHIYVIAFLHVYQALQMPLGSLPAKKKHDLKKQGCQR